MRASEISLAIGAKRSTRHFIAALLLSWLILTTTLSAAELPTADQSRGEWTLVVIPDTQGYLEPWPEQGFEWAEVKNTLEWFTYSHVKDYYWTKDSDSQGTFTLVQNDPAGGTED